MEWTRFECGIFMNYLGFGVSAERGKGKLREEALGGREGEEEVYYYVTESRAELPVMADEETFPRITMTAIEDVGVFVAKALDLEKWETVSCMVGETLRMDEVVRIVEKVMGKKWEIMTVAPAEWEERIRCEKDEVKKFWAQLGLIYSRDKVGQGVLEPRLNENFPDVKPLTVEQYMRKYYI